MSILLGRFLKNYYIDIGNFKEIIKKMEIQQFKNS